MLKKNNNKINQMQAITNLTNAAAVVALVGEQNSNLINHGNKNQSYDIQLSEGM